MTTFEDGPAKGQTLMLKRAAVFLRVVESNGTWDALDQLDDTPKPEEKIYAYQIIGKPGMMHLNRGGGRSGWYAIASYRLISPQPSDTEMRSTDAWWDWTEQHTTT
jgi:hypothetical protein